MEPLKRYEYKFLPSSIIEKKDFMFDSLEKKCVNAIKRTNSTTPEIFKQSKCLGVNMTVKLFFY